MRAALRTYGAIPMGGGHGVCCCFELQRKLQPRELPRDDALFYKVTGLFVFKKKKKRPSGDLPIWSSGISDSMGGSSSEL